MILEPSVFWCPFVLVGLHKGTVAHYSKARVLELLAHTIIE